MPFDIDVFVVPKDKGFGGAVTVYMEQTVNVKYEPRVLTLRPGERKTVRVTIVKTQSGLAEVYASADGWKELDATVDAGFSARLKTNIEAPVEAGKERSFSIKFVDNKGEAVPLDAAVRLTLQASKVKLRYPGQEWSDRLTVEVEANKSSSPVLELLPEGWGSDVGVVTAEVMSDDGLVLHDSHISVNILPRWYVPLLMSILGGLLYSLYQLSKALAGRSRYTVRYVLTSGFVGVFTGALAGVLAYLLAEWGVLGIQVDTTTLQGFVILGFLFAYVGIDAVLGTATRREVRPTASSVEAQTTPAAPSQTTPQTT